jgi:hypothetical protein
MAFTELLSSSFLFSIAIIVILIGLIFSYINYRMSEQDHKISSMLGLITTMAEEMQFFRSKLSRLTGPEQHHVVLDPNNLVNMVAGNSDLISVSDGDCNEEYEDEDDADDDDEDLEEDSEDDESDSCSEGDSEDELEEENIKVLNISGLGNDEIDIHTFEEHDDNLNIKSIHLEEPIDISQHKILSENISSDLKTISIVDLEETNKKTTDYKKMSLNKLREVVIEKGIVPDASKLKKNEILKLLGVE